MSAGVVSAGSLAVPAPPSTGAGGSTGLAVDFLARGFALADAFGIAGSTVDVGSAAGCATGAAVASGSGAVGATGSAVVWGFSTLALLGSGGTDAGPGSGTAGLSETQPPARTPLHVVSKMGWCLSDVDGNYPRSNPVSNCVSGQPYLE